MEVRLTSLKTPRLLYGVNADSTNYTPVVLNEKPFSAIWKVNGNPDLFEYEFETNNLLFLKQLMQSGKSPEHSYMCAEIVFPEKDFFLEVVILKSGIEVTGLLGEYFYDVRITSSNDIRMSRRTFKGVADFRTNNPKCCWTRKFEYTQDIDDIYNAILRKIKKEEEEQEIDYFDQETTSPYFRQSNHNRGNNWRSRQSNYGANNFN